MPKTERDFINGLRSAGEESAAQKILLIIDKIKEVFGDAVFVLTPSYQELLLKLHSSRQMLFKIKGEEAAALNATIDKIGTSLSTAVSSSGTAKAIAVSQAINVLTVVSSIGFVLYEFRQKKLENLSEISFLDNVLKSRIYIDLLKRYLIKNKAKYLSDESITTIDLTSSDVVIPIVKEVIRDFAEEVAILLYIRHEFLLEKLSNKGFRDLLDFFKESIAYHAKAEPAVLLTYGEPIECLLRATFPTINSKLFFIDKRGHTKRLETLQPTEQDYTIGHYLHFTNRFEVNLSGLEPNIAFTGVKLVGRNELPLVRTSKVKLKYHSANMTSYPDLVLFQPETALSPTEYTESPHINPNITLVRRTISTYLMYNTLNAINERLLELNKIQLFITPIPGPTPTAERLEQVLTLTARIATKLSSQVPKIAREADEMIPTIIQFIATATSFTQALAATQGVPQGVTDAKGALKDAIAAKLQLTPAAITTLSTAARTLLTAITGAHNIPEPITIATRDLTAALDAAPQVAATIVTSACALIRVINLNIAQLSSNIIIKTRKLIQEILTSIPNVPPEVIAAANALTQAFDVSTTLSLRVPNIVAIANVMKQILVAVEKIPNAMALQGIYAPLEEVRTAARYLRTSLNVPELTFPEENHLSQLVNIAKTEARWIVNTLRLPISPLVLRALTVRVATLQVILKIATIKSMLKEKLDYNIPQSGYLREALGLVEKRAAILNVVAQQVTAFNVAMNAIARTRGITQVVPGNSLQAISVGASQTPLLNITQLELNSILPATLLRVIQPAATALAAAPPAPDEPTALTQQHLDAIQQIAAQQITALNAAIGSALTLISLPASETIENSILQVAALETNLQTAAKQANILVGILKEALQRTDTQVATMQEALDEITRQSIKLQECSSNLESPVTTDVSIGNAAFKVIVTLHKQAMLLETNITALKELPLFNLKDLLPVPSINLEGLDPDCASDDESTATMESLENKRRIVLTKQAKAESLTIMYRAKAEKLASRIQRRQQEASTSGAAPSVL